MRSTAPTVVVPKPSRSANHSRDLLTTLSPPSDLTDDVGARGGRNAAMTAKTPSAQQYAW
jgi:hypothetical protein